MSFGVFSSKFGSEDVSLDMAIAHEHPDYSADSTGEFMIDAEGEGTMTESQPVLPTPTAPPSEIPWALIVPAAVIGVAAIGIGWYMLSGKKAEIPI